MPDVQLSRYEVEFNEKWIRKNPDLFSKSLKKFFKKVEENDLTFIGREYFCGSFTYIAEKT